MLEASDTNFAPWHIVRSDNKRCARLNCISHLLSLVPYEDVPGTPGKKVRLPKLDTSDAYDDLKSLKGRRFIPEVF